MGIALLAGAHALGHLYTQKEYSVLYSSISTKKLPCCYEYGSSGWLQSTTYSSPICVNSSSGNRASLGARSGLVWSGSLIYYREKNNTKESNLQNRASANCQSVKSAPVVVFRFRFPGWFSFFFPSQKGWPPLPPPPPFQTGTCALHYTLLYLYIHPNCFPFNPHTHQNIYTYTYIHMQSAADLQSYICICICYPCIIYICICIQLHDI